MCEVEVKVIDAITVEAMEGAKVVCTEREGESERMVSKEHGV